jgi:hypothetical protein
MNNTDNLHTEHQGWLADLTYWHNELMYFDRVLLRLAEGAKEESDMDKLEEFKSAFDKLQDSFEEVKKEIQAHETALNNNSDGHDRHEQIRGKVREFRNTFQNVKNEFFNFEEKFIYM